MEVYRVKTGSILPLGKQGENLVRQIQFDLSRWISNFGPGTVQLLHERKGDEAPYPVAVEQEGNLAVWTVTSADTAAAGTGRAELQYYVGDALAKSETWMTKVLPALGDASETPPEAQQGWVDQVLQAGAAAAEAADRAEEAAVRQPYPNAETGTWWVWNAESGAYEDTGISYGTGDSGGGVTDHEELTGRDKADQHPMSAITGLEDALAGKQPTGTYLTEETDPTVPDWAKEETKPSYTAAEVGADPSGTAASQVSVHNTETTAHSDIRLLIQSLTERLNTLADSDDTTLDQLSEVVSYIKSNRTLIEAITTSKVSVADIIDNLTTNVTNKPLSSAQGVALKAMIDAITIPTALPNPNALTFTGAVSGSYDGSAPMEVEIPSGGGGLTVTNTAAVGQTIKVSAVDETGQPTEWEAVDMAGGSVGGQVFDEVVTLSEAVNGWRIDVPKGITDVKLRIVIPAVESSMTYGYVLTNGAQSNFLTINWGDTSGETISFVSWLVFKNCVDGQFLPGNGAHWMRSSSFTDAVKDVTSLTSIGIKSYDAQTFPVGTTISVRGRS